MSVAHDTKIRTALKLELLLGVRIGEALGATKHEIDLECREWSIPAVRTRYRTPLTSACT